MIENKLNIKFLSIRGIAFKLSSHITLPGWHYTLPENKELFSEFAPSSLFNTISNDPDISENKNSNNDNLLGLKNLVVSFQGSIKILSDKLNGFSLGAMYKSAKEKIITNDTYTDSERLFSNIDTGIVKNHGVQQSISPGIGLKLLLQKTSNILREKNSIINDNFISNENNFLTKEQKSNSHFRETNTMFQNPPLNKEKILDTDFLKKISFTKNNIPERPSYTIHQTFGDIVVQPGSMDVSMQQLKVKIQDILKQARDSSY